MHAGKTCSVGQTDQLSGVNIGSIFTIYSKYIPRGCGCCEYQSSLVLPGDCKTLPDGRQACCCDGEMVVTVEQSLPAEELSAAEKLFSPPVVELV